MKKLVLAALSAFMILALTACGGDGGGTIIIPPQPTTVNILSDPAFDGDIVQALTGVRTVTQGMTLSPIVVQSVFAGLDPATGDEFRAFLNFNLAGVPGNAGIDSAFLDFFIDSISPQSPTGTIPLRVDLLSFQPPNLVGTNFDRTLLPVDFDLQPLATITVTATIAFNGQVTIDVTPLMVVAQDTGQLDFQVRIVGIAAPGLIEINDTTGVDRGTLAPLLQVTFF